MSDAAERVPRLSILEVLRVVWRVYRRRWKFLVPLSIVVLLPQALADAALGDVEIDRVETVEDLLHLASIPLAVAVNLGGEALYAGIVAAAVVEWLAGPRAARLPPTRSARSRSGGSSPWT